jgi:phosphonate transport system permease protein
MLMIVVVVVTMIIDQLSGMVRHRIIEGRWELPIVTALRRRSVKRARSESVDLKITADD